uniref:Putative ovule protein n=1 Tax=Solanum chacoense TaxID=4108 RepID=A0A0V0HB42_SOLCH
MMASWNLKLPAKRKLLSNQLFCTTDPSACIFTGTSNMKSSLHLAMASSTLFFLVISGFTHLVLAL